IPRCCSMAIQSEVAWRWFLRARTEPASWIAPPYSSSFSVSVVFPASGCEMIANVRRRRISVKRLSLIVYLESKRPPAKARRGLSILLLGDRTLLYGQESSVSSEQAEPQPQRSPRSQRDT